MNVVSNRKLQTHSGVKIENFWADVNYRGQSGKCGHIYHNSLSTSGDQALGELSTELVATNIDSVQVYRIQGESELSVEL